MGMFDDFFERIIEIQNPPIKELTPEEYLKQVDFSDHTIYDLPERYKCPRCSKYELVCYHKKVKIKRIKKINGETIVTTKYESFPVLSCGKCRFYHDYSEDV